MQLNVDQGVKVKCNFDSSNNSMFCQTHKMMLTHSEKIEIFFFEETFLQQRTRFNGCKAWRFTKDRMTRAAIVKNVVFPLSLHMFY